MTVKQGLLEIETNVAIRQAPAKVIPASRPIDRIIIAITEDKATERVIPRALAVARETGAELSIVYVYKSSAKRYVRDWGLARQTDVVDHQQHDAEQYLSSIKSKLTSQYSNVSAFLFEGMDVVSAITTIAEDCHHPYVILAQPEPRRILKAIIKNTSAQLADRLGHQAEIEKI